MNHFPLKTVVTAASTALLTAGLLTACAVGPNFKAPPAPRDAAFVPAGQIAPETTAAPLPGGPARRFAKRTRTWLRNAEATIRVARGRCKANARKVPGLLSAFPDSRVPIITTC